MATTVPAVQHRWRRFILDLSRMTQLLCGTIFLIFRAPPRWRHVSRQMVNFGLGSLPVVLVTGAFTGMVLAVQTYYQFKQMSMESLIGAIVGLSMTNELGPVLTAIVVAGRVGAAMAAELGTMKVTEQIDALQSLAMDPRRYLVAPRFLAGVIMIPLLTVFSIAVGILGGYVVGVHLKGINAAFFMEKLTSFTTPYDVYTGLIKSVCFSVIIVTVSCHKGFTAEGGAEGVGRAATATVVISSISILIADFFLGIILF